MNCKIAIGYTLFGAVCIFVPRMLFGIYRRIWRYASASDYLTLVVSDMIGGAVFILGRYCVPTMITFVRAVSVICLNLLGAICMRLIYQVIYLERNRDSKIEGYLVRLVNILSGTRIMRDEAVSESRKIKIAIVGAGSVGAMLAEDLLGNPKAVYLPVCFVDVNKEKVGGLISGIPIISNVSVGPELERYQVQEVVFALPNADNEKRKALYDIYKGLGYKIKSYDFPSFDSDTGKRSIHDFAIEDLLYRKEIRVVDEQTLAWYRGKTILITGGGGSIGSELARQIAKAEPGRLILLDVYENGVYDVQQELRMQYGDALNLRVEIANVCDAEHIRKLFNHHRPDIVLHAAAHTHVPLMERNVCEAVKNNVFGTLNVVEACESSGVRRFIMVSTDKAVNPTNVMGATKRMCEMIVLSRTGKVTSFSATRFGNVLGSNGSVIPLFKRQIQRGGPITITDKRITRYFMTIPEASQLVMISGAMASNGELYVLDMGEPIKILELAEDMIRLSGMEPYKDIDIVEVGLRQGEKLYEELLIRTEELDKTDNELIFIERDKRLEQGQVERKLDLLREAVATGSNHRVREALMKVIPTYHTPEEVNERTFVA
ncbi:MAG: polysaccharide biosynthesis protein [Clostridia bacterium]|nr:polysaccharide biosynthesis protein [Clostridia bacterium]